MGWDWKLIDGPDTITEGPAWDGEGLLYTAINHNEIRRYVPSTGKISVVYSDTGEANGLILGPDGTLYACEGGRRAVVAYDNTGKRSVIVDRFEGNRLNSPNDLVLDAKGNVWFTDPRYGDFHDDRELDHDSVYRAEKRADRWELVRLTFDTTRPNGLLLSPDESSLYVAQSNHTPSEPRELRRYPILADGSLGAMRVLHDFGEYRGIDGMCFDTDGNIVATCGREGIGTGGRIVIFSAEGDLLEDQQLPAGSPTNCVFGGPDLDVLYVTTLTGHLYEVAGLGRIGALQPPQQRPFVG